MTENPDYQALAKRYLDLWQDQVAKLAKDPGALSGAAEAWSQMAASMMQAPPNARPSSPASPGAPAPAAAHGGGGLDPADLLRRIAELERRIALLESAAGPAPSNNQGSAPKAAARPRRTKPPSA